MGDFVWAMAVTVGLSVATLLWCSLLEKVGPRERITWRDRVPGVMMNSAGSACTFLLVWPLSKLWLTLGISAQITIPLWRWLEPLGWLGLGLQFLCLALLADFLAYWRHRFEHRVLWPIHSVHHAPRHLHAANDIGHPLQALYGVAFLSVPLSLIQVDGPALPTALAALIGMLSIYIHSPVEVHLGPLRRLIVDNRFHRIHHSIEPRHFNKNFGICFSCWDHMFGTAYEPGDEWPVVGLADVPPPRNVLDSLLMPFRPASVSPDTVEPSQGAKLQQVPPIR